MKESLSVYDPLVTAPSLIDPFYFPFWAFSSVLFYYFAVGNSQAEVHGIGKYLRNPLGTTLESKIMLSMLPISSLY